LLRRMVRSLVAWLLAGTVLLGPGAAPAAADGNYTNCSAQNPTLHLRWSANSQTFSRPDTWAANYRTALANASSNINSTTDFSWIRVSSGAVAPWANWNDPNSPGLAGVTQSSFNNTTCRFTDQWFYFNFPHTDGDNVDQRQCTAVHEFGHGLGLNHVSGFRAMNANHTYRCHTNMIKTFQGVDSAEANVLY